MQLLYNNFQVCNEKHYIKDYGNYKEIYIIKSVKDSGFECINKKKSSNSEKNRVEISRIKSKIKDYAIMNNFDYFYTQTINSNYDRFNLEEFKKIILKKFKAYKRINKDFIYLIIFEKHLDGAFHLHGLVSGLGIDLHKNSNGYDTLEYFTDIGYNSISKIKNKIAISNYILKYISKDFCKTLSGYSYFHSKNLKLPIIQETYIDTFSNLKLIFENEYIKKYEVI